jgi:plasmid stabilization system protein ParE
MKVVYLQSALPDIAWMRHYYRTVFPQGQSAALTQLASVERLIMDNPAVGKMLGEAREFPISRTPFSLIYREKSGRIEVLRIWDHRRDRAEFEL